MHLISISGVRFIIMLFLALSLFLTGSSHADPLDNWHVVRTTGQDDNPLHAITYGNGMFVAVGESGPYGTILTSTDGTVWTTQTIDKGCRLHSVTYGNGLFVAAGSCGRILTSSDGYTWTERSPGRPRGLTELLGAAYGNGVFVAVGRSYGGLSLPVVIPSAEDLTWQETFLFMGGITLYSIAFGNGSFVAVGDNGFIATSPNGMVWKWTQKSLGASVGTSYVLLGVTFAQGKFVAVGSSGTILTSPDGVTWTIQESGTVYPPFTSVAYGNGFFVIAGGVHDDAFNMLPDISILFSSSDAVTWRERPPGTSQKLSGVAFGKDTFVAVGPEGTIIQSDPVPDLRCTAILSPELSLHVPRIDLNGASLSAELRYQQGVSGDVLFKATSAGIVGNPGDFSGCRASTLSLDDQTGDYLLKVPSILYGDILYWGDFSYVPTSDGAVWFKLIRAGLQ